MNYLCKYCMGIIKIALLGGLFSMPKLQLQHTSMKIIIAMFYTSLVWGVWCDLRIIFLVGGLLCLHTTLLPSLSDPYMALSVYWPLYMLWRASTTAYDGAAESKWSIHGSQCLVTLIYAVESLNNCILWCCRVKVIHTWFSVSSDHYTCCGEPQLLHTMVLQSQSDPYMALSDPWQTSPREGPHRISVWALKEWPV